MSTPKQLLAKLLERRPKMDNKVPIKALKFVYLHLTKEMIGVREEYQNEANLLAQAMNDAYAARGDGLGSDGTDHDPSACTVSFISKSAAKKAAQFLADIDGFWRGKREGVESIGDYHLRDNTIRCRIEYVCSYFDPNGLMDFDFNEFQEGSVVTIDRDQRQIAKKYLDALSRVRERGIIPDWPYADVDRDRIWRTHQLKEKLTRLMVSSCQVTKPRPEITVPNQKITFQDDEEGIDILVDGKVPKKFSSAARRAFLALALHPDLAAIDTKKFCKAYDPNWAKANAGTKNVSKKFSQAMQALRGVVPELHYELLSDGTARVAGLEFKNRPSETKLKMQIGFLLKPQSN